MVIHYLRTNSSFLNSGLGHHRLLLSAVDCVWSVSCRVKVQGQVTIKGVVDWQVGGGVELFNFQNKLLELLGFFFFPVFFLSFLAKWPLSEDTEFYAHALRKIL